MPLCDVVLRYRDSRAIRVSILVLVDAALRLGQEYEVYEIVISGFNPCFSGCRSATAETRNGCLQLQRVSILVLVDAALRQENYQTVLQTSFQDVSILVLVDAALRH